MIIPIPKNDDYEEAVNNRPISLLLVVSKICERVVDNQLINYLAENGRLPVKVATENNTPETFGLSVTDYILDAMDKKQVTAMVLLDFSKVFDSIGHTILLKKLQGLGVSQCLTIVYLVRIGKSLLTSKTVTHGMPQGSILALLLFNLYIHDLSSVCNGSQIDSFVDDTKLYAALKFTDLVCGLDCLMTNLNKVAGWCCYNQLLINLEKTQYILFGTCQLLQ